MLKYAFLAHGTQYNAFINDIKELGVVHIIESKKEPTTKIVEQYGMMGEVAHAIQFLQHLSTKTLPTTGTEALPGDAPSLLSLVKSLQVDLEQTNQQILVLEKVKQQLLPWGHFSWERIDRIQEAGLQTHFFSCTRRSFNPQWEESHHLFRIAESFDLVYFLLLLPPTEPLPQWDTDEIRLPRTSLAELETQMDALATQQSDINNRLFSIASTKLPLLQMHFFELKDHWVDEKVRLDTRSELDGNLMILEGWVPQTATVALDAYLEQSEVVSVTETHNDGEKPPILLKNNRFARLFEMIGNLYSLPNYSELDLTPYLAPFYLLFFGFCFSDAGYGLLVVLAATIAKKRSQKHAPIFTLAQLLGTSTIFFGLLGGTFFGINLYNTQLPVYSNLNAMLKASNTTLQDIMFKGALYLGAIQILFGMFVRAGKLIKQQGFKHAISTLSWALLLMLSAINYLLAKRGMVEQWNHVYLALGAVFLAGILFMNMPGKNLLWNLGGALWDAYNTLVGGIGDLLSYVRLFALGLSSATLGQIFNQMGFLLTNPDSGIFMQIVGYIAMAIVLLIGHSINIFMSALGSMVHPMRLTFVEFFKSAGFEGGGKPYLPFKKQTM